MEKHRGFLMLALVLVPLSGGCPAEEDPPAASGAAVADEAAVCLQGEPFVADGGIPLQGTGAGDADRVSRLRWEAHDGCERMVIDLGAGEDGPASSAGEVRAELLRGLGVVRVSLREVEWVDPDATDATFQGPLARAAYAVWSDEGRWVYVDLHLAEAAEAHMAVLDDPARVVVDLRPGGQPIPQPAVTGDRVVVLEPRPGTVTYPLTVTGYSRTFEANVIARLEQDGTDVHESFTTATAWVDAWGHFSLTIADGPQGPHRLHVGEYSAKDGTWEGVAIDLTTSGDAPRASVGP